MTIVELEWRQAAMQISALTMPRSAIHMRPSTRAGRHRCHDLLQGLGVVRVAADTS